ncbi:MAG: glycosyltransferase family 4 protein [Planctomycetota bacterium]
MLVLEWNIRLLSLVPAILKARMAGLRVIVWGHGFSKHESPIKAFFRRSAARLAHGVMFYNRGTAERHVRSHGFDPSRVYVAINSLDQRPIAGARERCVAEPDGVRALRDEHRIDGPLILYVSRLLEENRAELLFDALVVLRERFPGVTVAIIGAGPDEERLRNEAGAKGVAEHVRFLGKIYGEDRLSWWFSASDVFCYPQNIGLAMMHAMGYGVPVVTSDSPDLHGPEIEALVNGENGLLYKHGDGADLAEKLAAILSDPDLRARMSEAALETVRERFSLDRMVDGYEAAVRGSAPVDSFR